MWNGLSKGSSIQVNPRNTRSSHVTKRTEEGRINPGPARLAQSLATSWMALTIAAGCSPPSSPVTSSALAVECHGIQRSLCAEVVDIAAEVVPPEQRPVTAEVGPPQSCDGARPCPAEAPPDCHVRASILFTMETGITAVVEVSGPRESLSVRIWDGPTQRQEGSASSRVGQFCSALDPVPEAPILATASPTAASVAPP